MIFAVACICFQIHVRTCARVRYGQERVRCAEFLPLAEDGNMYLSVVEKRTFTLLLCAGYSGFTLFSKVLVSWCETV